MKKTYLFLITLIATMSFSAGKATTWMVMVGPSGTTTFSPANITNAVVGDVVEFMWSTGFHTTTGDAANIPPGAATWDASINSSSPTFSYTIQVAGTYTYYCKFHGSPTSGMKGTFTATVPLGVNELNVNVASVASPNPFKDKLTIAHPKANLLKVYNVTGKLMNTFSLEAMENQSEIDLSNLPKGIYFYSLVSEGAVIETKKIVKSE